VNVLHYLIVASFPKKTMPDSPINEIKEKLDVVEIIKGYIKVEKCGANYRARCPFHSEKKPSFFISPSRQIWHCFGCGLGGDIFGFVKNIEGVEFGDALKMLAEKAGVQLRPMRPELKTERHRLYEICELACKFFEKQLEASKSGRAAKEYLLGRGIKEQSIGKWRIGYAPDKFRSLSDFLISKGYNISEIKKAGLATSNKGGNSFDRFQSRIIFPVFDLSSQVIGFGGRIFGPREKDEIAKYVNTPSTILYDKSSTLYGLDKARVEVRRRDAVILVEGYTDCIMAHQSGSENTVATSGTSLTLSQLKILKRYSENLVTAFDMDVAGDSATKRGIDLAQKLDFNIKVITMPESKDPADVISQDSETWKKLVKDAKSIFDFYFETTLSSFDKNDPDDKREISKILLPVIKKISNKILQSHWVQRLSVELGVRMEDVEEELEKVKLEKEHVDNPDPSSELPENSSLKTRKQKIEERLLSILFKDLESHKLIDEKALSFMSNRSSSIILKLKQLFTGENNSKFDFSNFQKELTSEENSFINPLILKSEVEEEFSEMEPLEEMKICVDEIKKFGVKDKLKLLSLEIKKAEQGKDYEKAKKLISEFDEFAKELTNK